MTEVYDLPLSSGVVISTLFDKPTLFNNISKTFINFMFFACLYSCKTNAKNSAGEKNCKQQSVSDKGSLSKDDDGSEDVKNAKGSDAVYRVADKFLNGRIFYLCKQFTPNHANSVTDSRTLCQ